MSLPDLIFTCVLTVLGGGETPRECKRHPVVAESAAAMKAAAAEHGLPAPIIAAVAFHESKFNPRAIGPDGLDIGLMQVRRGGAIPKRLLHLSDRALQNIRLNVGIGASYLARMMRSCPVYFLSRYNGRPCRPSTYHRAVMRGLSAAQAWRTFYVLAQPPKNQLSSRLWRPTY